MSTPTTRRVARARALSAFSAALDRLIPLEDSVTVKGGTFGGSWNQIEELAQSVLPMLLVIGVDDGRVQSREKNSEMGVPYSGWRGLSCRAMRRGFLRPSFA